MFGHACFPVEPVCGPPDLWDGDGFVGVGVVVVVEGVLLAALVVVAADAPLMPAAAPALASAPATIVAPSILDIFMVRTS
jgi:hypothetical protein